MRKQKFVDLVFFFKKGVKTGILFTFDFAFLMMEYYLSNGMPVLIEYDNGKVKEIKNLKELAKLKREILKQTIKEDPEVKEILEKIAQQD
jgi:hypothetical protein